MARAQTTEVVGDVAEVEHAGTSTDGNPTYRVRLVDGRSMLTETDGAVGYGATNFRRHSDRRPVSPVVLTVNRRGRIIAMRRPEGWTEEGARAELERSRRLIPVQLTPEDLQTLVDAARDRAEQSLDQARTEGPDEGLAADLEHAAAEYDAAADALEAAQAAHQQTADAL
jgi:hypothetical protein